MNYFLVYDEYNNPRVREVISQNGLHLEQSTIKPSLLIPQYDPINILFYWLKQPMGSAFYLL